MALLMLSQTVGYAIAALGHLSRIQRQHGALFVRDIAQATGIPPAYLAKIVHQLARKGFLSTQRGTNGGVTLARRAEEVTLFEICEAFDDPIVLKRCMLGAAACSEERDCPAHSFWTEERERVADFLRRTTLREIARFENEKAPLVPTQPRRKKT
jgi:Rrf2 family protein